MAGKKQKAGKVVRCRVPQEEMEERYMWVRQQLAKSPNGMGVSAKISAKYGITARQARRYIKAARERMALATLPGSSDEASENAAHALERIQRIGVQAEKNEDFRTALAAAHFDHQHAMQHRAYLMAVEAAMDVPAAEQIEAAIATLERFADELSKAQRRRARRAVAT